MAEQNGFRDKVGLHLVHDEGVPLTDRIKTNLKICRDGKFIKGWFAGIKNKLFLTAFDKQCLEEEIEAQMKVYCDAGYSLMHIDSHHLVHTSSPWMINTVIRLATKYGFKSMRNVAVYPKDNAINKMAKKYVAKQIRKHFETTKYFASYSQFPLELDDVEYMSHPDMVDGQVIDYENRRTRQYRIFER